uniref:CCDC113/CCDC96 coiled-coil domain-containing protein n=1 Tax=Phaeomonas parva TaxID=124430 RepID=A0A7S1XLH1_9STRA
MGGTLIDPEVDLAPAGVLVYRDMPPLPLEADDLDLNFSGPYPDFSNDMVLQLLPSQVEVDGASVRALLHLEPAGGCSFYGKLFYAPKEEVAKAVEAEAEGQAVAMPLPGSLVAQVVVAQVDDGDPDTSIAVFPVESDVESITMQAATGRMFSSEEKRARGLAHQEARESDKEPVVEVDVIVNAGAIVPSELFFQQLFLAPDRLSDHSVLNMSVCGKRMDGDTTAMPLLELAFAETPDGSAPELPEGWEMLSENIIEMVAHAHGEAGAAEPASGGGVFLIGERIPDGSEEDETLSPIVDMALVYGHEDFEMGGGYVTKMVPHAVVHDLGFLDAEQAYLCYKKEGAGHDYAKQMALEATQQAETVANAERERIASMGAKGSAAANDVDDIELDAVIEGGLGEEEMKAREMARIAEMRAQAELRRQQREEEELNARENGLIELVEQLEGQKDGLLERNVELQRKIVELMASRKRREAASAATASAIAGNAPEKSAAGVAPAGQPEGSRASQQESEKAYAEALANIMALKAKLKRHQREKEQYMYDLQARLDDKELRVRDIYASFGEFKREIMSGAQNSRTGKAIPRGVIGRFEVEEQAKDKEMESVRLKNIDFRMRLKKVEASLRAKEQLAEGLHLIDFEQLKIENQTLNEKIEDRNEELNKLRKKNTHTVQILTHLKEKLQFVQAENEVQSEELRKLDSSLAHERDRLSRHKHDREALRAENARLRQQEGFANSDLLVQDYGQRQQQLDAMRRQVRESRKQYRVLEQGLRESQQMMQAYATGDGMMPMDPLEPTARGQMVSPGGMM